MKWYSIVSRADKAEIWIYEYIGEDFWTGGGVTAKNFQKELSEIKASQIDLHINSPGGSVFDGITIYNLLKQHPATITTFIDGLAASISSVIALAGDTVTMAENALFMIHNPSGMAMGTAADMRSLADVLDKIAGTMVTTYAGKTGKPESDIEAMMEAETWMTAEEAKEMGFIDEIGEEMDLATCAKFLPAMKKMQFKHLPEAFNAYRSLPDIRGLEKALRDAGCSSREAKRILAGGYSGGQRATDPPADHPRVDEPQPDAEPQRSNDNSIRELLRRSFMIPRRQTTN